MPDLPALLAAEARRNEPASVPDFDDLLVRAVRRQRRRGISAASAVVAVVVAVAFGGWWLAPRSSSSPSIAAPTASVSAPTVAATVPTAVYDKLRAAALALGAQNGDPAPSRMEAVQVDVGVPEASRRPDPSTAPLTTGYVVEIGGQFTCGYCKGPDLRGSVMRQRLGPDLTPMGTDFGGAWQDLAKYGRPFTLSPATVEAGPTTLAAAEKLALSRAQDAGSARIAWGLRTTAKALRAAGQSIAAEVPDRTPMFVVAVHSPGRRSGAIYRGDGSTSTIGDEVSSGGYFTKLEPATLPQATIVPYGSLEPMLSGFAPAPKADLADAIPVQVAVDQAFGPSGPQGGEKARAALTHTKPVNGHSGVAWVVELSFPSAPGRRIPPSEWVVDATTGVGYASAQP